MKILLLILFILFLTVEFGLCNTNSYDMYGQKTGNFKKDSSGKITEYDKYGKK